MTQSVRWLGRYATVLGIGVVLAGPLAPGGASGAQSLSFSALPVFRSLDAPPDVASTITLQEAMGARRMMPLIPALAVADLRLYAEQLRALFPRRARDYPSDSLRQLMRSRATAWVARLNATPHLDERQFTDFAEVAMLADQDTMVQRLIETRLAQLPAGRVGDVARALTLEAGIALLTADSLQDSVRLARNVRVAGTYLTRLLALPRDGYPTRIDRADVVNQQRRAMTNVIEAYLALRDVAGLLIETSRIIAYVRPWDLAARQQFVFGNYPYLDAIVAFQGLPGGQVALDTVRAQLIALGTARDDDPFPAAAARGEDRSAWQRKTQRYFETLTNVIGRPFHPVVAHAWLNTPDSAYTAIPRAHALTDGIVRVVMYLGKDSERLTVLDRIQRELPPGAQVLVVTSTTGANGPDAASPADEVAWLSRFYRTKRDAHVPVAIWAGEKVQGEYGLWHVKEIPQDNSNYLLGDLCLIVDGTGIIRAMEYLRSRADEAKVVRFVRQVRATPPAVPVANPSVRSSAPSPSR